ncbi:MAG: glycosyltransferase [Chloroflexi bacterium]|jgi:glycosyltransferase involved in cell wall biosynthesis|nr:glycosyltransferase [Chloroflexota bacterium]MBT4841943.1 glycosyltransferase [Anaerolineae bacterium]MBT4533818.1 glycosyltransferase [Chloroflexota bacterium]MBT6062611.1 glycosyltransferase [Anaerolineae bacterium]MBT6321206.1 glycosyltransferase [Anaerolineae bacterium]
MKVKRRVLHLVDHMGLGGAQRLIQGLVTNGYGNAIIALRRKGKLIGKIPDGIPIFIGEYFPLAYFFSLQKIYQVIRKFNIKYIHCHLPISVVFGIVLSYLDPSLRFVFHEHGDLAGGNWLYRILLSKAAKRGKIIVNSKNQKKLCQKIGLKNELVLIYNFINHNEFYIDREDGDNFREKLGLGKEKILIGFAGRLIPSKGWEDLLLVWQGISRSNVVLIIAGDGNDFPRIEKYAQNYQISNFQLLGHIVEMRAFYNALDIFVLPTKIEAFGLSQIEAQACGVPTIVYNTKGLNETVDRSNSILVKLESIEELQVATESLLAKLDLREKMSKAGISNAGRFTAKKYIKKLLEDV